MKHATGLLAATLLCTLLARPAAAVPILGQQLFYGGGDVTVEILQPSAAYNSQISLYLPDLTTIVQTIGLSQNAGDITMFNPGAQGYAVGDELIFGILVQNTSHSFFMGPGWRNPDQIMHATVDALGGNEYMVGFEDLFGGGDTDYDDARFLLTAVPTAISEPATLGLFGVGLIGFGLLGRRKRAK